MEIVDGMYREKDTLKTAIKINVLGIEHSEGSNWSRTGTKDWDTLLDEDLNDIATESSYNANLFIFITNGSSKSSYVGLAQMGVLCNYNPGDRISINGYLEGYSKSGDSETASVCSSSIFFTKAQQLFGTTSLNL